MIPYKILSQVVNEIDVDFQLLCEELDTNAVNLRFVSDNILSDCNEIHAFSKLFEEVKMEGDYCSSYDDLTDIYEFKKMVLILHNSLSCKYIILDNHDFSKFTIALNSYR